MMADNDVPTILDYNNCCHTYSSVISRHREAYVKSDEITKLQSDLEQLLADAEGRLAWLQSENETVDSSDKGVSSDSSDSQCVSSPKHKTGCKRGRPQVNDKIKNIKLSSRLFKNKIKKTQPMVSEKVPHVISDKPHQFWQSLDAWCSDITLEDVERLQELLKSQDNDDEYFKVPALGTHYSQRWALEDLMAEQREGSEPHGRNSEISNITPASLAQLENKPSTSSTSVGPLTEKLLSSLIEEGVCFRDSGDELDDLEELQSPKKHEVGGGTWSVSHVESRVREELVQLGVLEESEGESEDEVLSELLSKQQELRDLVEYNREQLKLLYDTTLEYMKQQDIRHKIDELDEEVCDTYRNFMLKKHKKVPYTKKEKDQASKLLQDREDFNKMLLENSFLT